MEVLYERCCGIDVHSRSIVACVRKGKKNEIREYGTYTRDLLELAEWLKESKCMMVAMESTGVYWKPLMNIFEMEEIPAIVVNAQHMKALPGRKTDVKDAEWIADLLQHGLLRASFIPDKEMRELRDLLRYRKSKTEERTREINRLQKFLEGANVKLTETISDINGVTGRKLLNLLIRGKTIQIEDIESSRDGRLKVSSEELLKACEGYFSALQRELVQEVIRNIDTLNQAIERLEEMVDRYLSDSYSDAAKKLEKIPGIGEISSQVIVAETGIDMSRFPNADHFCSWAGLSPGNNQSAKKRKNSKTNKANKTLKTTMIQCARSAVKNKDSFFYAQHQRLVVRRGANKAIVAVAHSMMIAVYHVLSGEDFVDLGSNYYNQFNRERKINSLLKQLERLDYPMTQVATA